MHMLFWEVGEKPRPLRGEDGFARRCGLRTALPAKESSCEGLCSTILTVPLPRV